MSINENQRKSKEFLLKAVDSCTSLSDVYTLVQSERIDVRMRNLSKASDIPPKKLDPKKLSDLSPEAYLNNIKNAVKEAIIASDLYE